MKNMFTEKDCAVQVTTEFAIQTAGWNSTQTAGDRSTQTAGWNSTQTAGWDSTQKAGSGSTQTAGWNSTQTAGINSIQIGWWHDAKGDYKIVSRTVTEKEADKPYKFENGVWTEVKTEKKIKNKIEDEKKPHQIHIWVVVNKHTNDQEVICFTRKDARYYIDDVSLCHRRDLCIKRAELKYMD